MRDLPCRLAGSCLSEVRIDNRKNFCYQKNPDHPKSYTHLMSNLAQWQMMVFGWLMTNNKTKKLLGVHSLIFSW